MLTFIRSEFQFKFLSTRYLVKYQKVLESRKGLSLNYPYTIKTDIRMRQEKKIEKKCDILVRNKHFMTTSSLQIITTNVYTARLFLS